MLHIDVIVVMSCHVTRVEHVMFPSPYLFLTSHFTHFSVLINNFCVRFMCDAISYDVLSLL